MKLNGKNLVILMLCFFMAEMLQAQMNSDVVYLKSGNVIKGQIVEQVPGKTIKVRTNDNLLIEINYHDIARIVKEETYAKRSGKTRLQDLGLKRYFFKGSGGYYFGKNVGYTFGVSAGVRLGKFDVAASFQKLLPGKKYTNGTLRPIYEEFDLQLYSLKGFYHFFPGRLVDPYIALGAGYCSSPKTTGPPKYASGTGYYGYYDSYFLNPAVGAEMRIAKNTFLFGELNYNRHRWTNTFALVPNPGLPPRNHAEFFSLLIGVKF